MEQIRIPELLDYRDLESIYNLKKSTISKLVMIGDFTNIVKVGRKNYFRSSDVEDWITEHTIEVA